MDLATILGMVVSFGLIMTALFLGGAPTSFIDVPAMLIVFGGTFGATLTHYPLGTFLRIGTIIRKTLVAKTPSSHMIIDQFMDYANRARREGPAEVREIIRTDVRHLRRFAEALAKAPSVIGFAVAGTGAARPPRRAAG